MSGDVVIPGNGEESLLIRRLRGTSGTQMPINQDPLDETTITLIETWIDEGALENEVYGCTHPNATNYDEAANVDDGSCEFASPNDYEILIEDFVFNMNEQITFETQNIFSPEKFYYMKVSGLWSGGGVEIDDAVYSQIETGSPNLNVYWTWNRFDGCQYDYVASHRPYPEEYNDEHIYYFYFYGLDETESFCFSTGYLPDNSGQLEFEIYEWVNEVEGCTDPEATNYDDTANVDDGSCTGSYDDFTFAGEYNEHYYFLYNYLADWHTAKIICENNNGHLLTITSEYEDSFISSIISTQSWLGLTDEINEGQWNWITGEPLTYTNWDGSEPNGGTEENYLERHPSGKWNDLRSGQSLSFILELESGYGCTDNAACNYDPVATWNDGSCTDYCGASNLSVIDIPNDQGGYVYLSFNKSVFDTETLNASPDGTTEGYLIERSDSGVWTGILSIYAYGEDLYQVEARTLADSTSISDVLTEYRVIAAMQEGNFLSDTTVTGYSVDNIAPTPPSSFLGLYDGSNNQAVLSWNQSEANDISHYNVYRNAELQGATTETSFTDEMTEDTEYAVSAVDIHENESGMSESVLVEMPDMNVIDNLIPTEYALKAAYPNPFNPVTNITYGLPEYTNVQIVIIDLSGKQVETLINEFQTPGYHSVNWDADNIPSGVYLIRMDSGEFTQTQKVMLVK